MVVVATQYDNTGTGIRDDWTFLDQFDRTIATKSRTLTGGYSWVGIQYDSLGRVERQTAPCDAASCAVYWSTNTYDLVGRVVEVKSRTGASTGIDKTSAVSYDRLKTVTTDAEGKQTIRRIDVNGRIRRSQNHNGYFQSFVYDSFGSLVSVTDSLSNTLFTATYSYGADAFKVASTDVDSGSHSYTINALGEVEGMTDAKSQAFSFTYDTLSRMTTRTESEGTTNIVYGNDPQERNIGAVKSMSSPGYSEALTYDGLGRLSQRAISMGSSHSYNYAYDSATGKLKNVLYPTSTSSYRLQLEYGYTYGGLRSVKDSQSSTVFWEANAVNSRGQIGQETFGNNVVTERDFDAATGQLAFIRSGLGGGSALQNASYFFDDVGNLTLRQDGNRGLAEGFVYDDLHRLWYSTLQNESGSTQNLTMAYDAMGNITSRSDVANGATWTYHSTKKHAVTQAGSASLTYSYDANGNAQTRNSYAIDWTSYNYPSVIRGDGKTMTFSYGPNRARFKQIYTSGAGTETTLYIGDSLEKVSVGSIDDWRHYIRTGSQTVAVVSRKSNGVNETRYMLEDHQGSAGEILDSSGAIYVSESFNAFGTRRDASTWSESCQCEDLSKIKNVSRRGYTGHEAVGGVSMGLTHMNGRVLDSVTGRFLSPDPYVTEPYATQAYNRYSYVYNNPLSFIDPNGFECFQNGYAAIAHHNGGDEVCITTITVTGQAPPARPPLLIPPVQIPNVGIPGGFTFTPGGDVATNPNGSVAAPPAPPPPEAVADDSVLVSADKVPESNQTKPPERDWRDSLRSYWRHDIKGLRCILAFDCEMPGQGGLDAVLAAFPPILGIPQVGAAQILKIERQLATHGRSSVLRSLRSLEKRIVEERAALETYRAQGGYTSSVEREIRAFEAEVQAIREVLGIAP